MEPQSKWSILISLVNDSTSTRMASLLFQFEQEDFDDDDDDDSDDGEAALIVEW